MSEDEQFEDSEQYEDEQDDRELITWVKANSFLYNKSEKLYSNNEVKNSAWDAIGNNLTNKKTGSEAEHRFIQLRQRFGRERKKVVQSQPRSGAGTSQPTYSSKWILYNDLMFLADVIKHRKTTTNYKRKHPKSQAIQVPKSQAIQQMMFPNVQICLTMSLYQLCKHLKAHRNLLDVLRLQSLQICLTMSFYQLCKHLKAYRNLLDVLRLQSLIVVE
ncbi:Uncharacterized protein DBV15_12025 [Temnothorax longispinosus]|uniref:MADF domain-containing protein n=1 Tax=Temnothorax longispinosus TaxID=300112 RepID=A0A4S2KMH3_9HYME|nr:Uncharacterized protein DBV15_12025 [Temnothorax longispinosus]